MIDVHSHILYGIDDGAKSLDDSIKILESACKNGVNTIFVTPHYIEKSRFIASNKIKEEILNRVEESFKGNIKLILGNEIYMSENISNLLKEDLIKPLGNSKYLLIELPVYNEFPDLENYLFLLRDKGYKIIIAHPERYYYFKKDFNKFLKLVKQGIYFQGNYMSLYDIYGKSTKKLFVKILKHHCYSFMASDIHTPKQDYYAKLDAAKKKIAKMTNKNYASLIFSENAAKIIKDEEVEVEFKEKISIFDRIRGNK